MMFVPSVYLDVAFQVDGKVWGCTRCDVTWIAVERQLCWSCREVHGMQLLWVTTPPELLYR